MFWSTDADLRSTLERVRLHCNTLKTANDEFEEAESRKSGQAPIPKETPGVHRDHLVHKGDEILTDPVTLECFDVPTRMFGLSPARQNDESTKISPSPPADLEHNISVETGDAVEAEVQETLKDPPTPEGADVIADTSITAERQPRTNFEADTTANGPALSPSCPVEVAEVTESVPASPPVIGPVTTEETAVEASFADTGKDDSALSAMADSAPQDSDKPDDPAPVAPGNAAASVAEETKGFGDSESICLKP